MEKEFVGKTKNGITIVVDLENSHAATHIADSPQLLPLLKEVISNLESMHDCQRFEINMGREIGTSDLVETDEYDDIVYAKRPNRDLYSRFVKNKKPIPTSWITLELKEVDDQTYEIFTAYIGRITPPFPGNTFETTESKAFWGKHALAWGKQEIVVGSETTVSPW